MTLFSKLSTRIRERKAQRALAKQLAETRASYKHQRYLSGREAALKSRPPRLKRIPYAWRERSHG